MNKVTSKQKSLKDSSFFPRFVRCREVAKEGEKKIKVKRRKKLTSRQACKVRRDDEKKEAKPDIRGMENHL